MGATVGVDPLVVEVVRRLMPRRTPDVRSLWSSLDVPERSFLARGRSTAGDGLAGLAADVGYADQAHLTRECVRLTGVTPRVFLAEVERSCRCGHDHEVSFAPLLGPRTLAVPFKNGAPGRS
jgi:hypothetical protein